MSFRWTASPTQVFNPAVTKYVAAIRRGVRQIADRFAPEIEAHMKREKVWVDRTGNATQTLHTEVEQTTQDMVTIILAHGVSYGVYLELSFSGRFSVITPALDVFAPRIWAAVQAMLR